jgi:hypothetical protein
MKTRFSGDIKVIEVLSPEKRSLGTIRRSEIPGGRYRYYARAGFDHEEVLFQTEEAARVYLIDYAKSSSKGQSIEEYLRGLKD